MTASEHQFNRVGIVVPAHNEEAYRKLSLKK